mgnify:CR=1 FL=1|jgi:hypothetical protein
MRNIAITPEEIEVRNHIQKAVGALLSARKDDQINLASSCARDNLAKQITTTVIQALKGAYDKDA